jgi:hypothetical protein
MAIPAKVACILREDAFVDGSAVQQGLSESAYGRGQINNGEGVAGLARPYTDAQKSAILEAVKAGKKWPEIHAAATEAGYKGGLQYLIKFAHKGGAVRRRRKSSVAAATAPIHKPGRPKGSKNAVRRGPGRPKAIPVAGNGAGLADIEAIVERTVEQRVRATVARAVRALEGATSGASWLDLLERQHLDQTARP